jgi:hypothetical protein
MRRQRSGSLAYRPQGVRKSTVTVSENLRVVCEIAEIVKTHAGALESRGVCMAPLIDRLHMPLIVKVRPAVYALLSGLATAGPSIFCHTLH